MKSIIAILIGAAILFLIVTGKAKPILNSLFGS